MIMTASSSAVQFQSKSNGHFKSPQGFASINLGLEPTCKDICLVWLKSPGLDCLLLSGKSEGLCEELAVLPACLSLTAM